MGNKIQRIYIGQNLVRPSHYRGLIAYRPLEANNKDISGHGYDVTITGCSFGEVGNKKGIRLSPSFTQTPTNYITTPDIGNPTTFSFAGWLYKVNSDTSGANDWTSFFDNATADTGYATRLRCKYKITRSIANGGGNSDAEGYTLAQNTWTHYSITSDGTTAKVYINGQYFNSFGTGTDNSDSTGVFYIGYGRGAYTSNRRSRPGWVRQFMFYNRVLTAEEINKIYTETQ